MHMSKVELIAAILKSEIFKTLGTDNLWRLNSIETR